MFISSRHYHQILSRLNTLERQVDTHGRFLHNDYEALGQHKEKIVELHKVVGRENPNMWDLSALSRLMYGLEADSPKPLTLVQKVNQIMQHLGLTVVHTPSETKLAPKPKKAAKKAITKKKGTK